MLNFFYTIFITPIIWLMSFLVEYLSKIIPSAGLVIILLSICINTMLIPVYRVFLGWQEEDRQKQLSMKDKLQMIQQSFAGQLRFMMIRTLYRQNNYHHIYSLRNSLGFLIQIPFFIAAYVYIGSNESLAGVSFLFISDLSKPDAALVLSNGMFINILPVFMTVVSIASAWQYTKNGTKAEKIQLFTLPLIFLVLLYNAASALVLYWSCNVIFAFIGNLVRSDSQSNKASNKGTYAVIFSSLGLIVVISTLYFPIRLLISDNSFGSDVTLQSLSVFSFQVFLLVSFIIYALSHFGFLRKLIGIVLPVLALFALFSTAYNFLDTGSLRGVNIPDIDALGKIYQRLPLDIVILSILYFVIRLCLRKYLLNIMLLSSLGVIVFSAYNYFDYKQGRTQIEITKLGKKQEPDYIHEISSFSKDKQNIVVLMLDTFNNQHVEVIREMMPEFDELFEGFTWYSNTISIANNTFFAEPAVHGGHYYAPYEINQRSDEVISLSDEIAKGYTIFVDNFSKQGFDVQLVGIQATSCEEVYKYTNPSICKELDQFDREFIPYYLNTHPLIGLNLTDGNIIEVLSAMGLYNVSPYSFRKKIYDNGKWMNIVKPSSDEIITNELKDYGHLEAFVEFANTNAINSTFKYIQTHYTHAPWRHEIATCTATSKPYIWNRDRENGLLSDQIPNEYCALKVLTRLFNWLKKEGIFDNTMIILVSDHDNGGDARLNQSFGENITQIKNNKDNYPGWPSGLLMIKDFNSNHSFLESTVMMSNADVPAIVCAQINGCNEIKEQDPRVSAKLNRSVIHSIGHSSNLRSGKNRYNIQYKYKITNNLYDPKNWQEILD